jgi:pyrroloquinoline-quinone synthase
MEAPHARFELKRSRLFADAAIERHPLFTSLLEGRFDREAERCIALEIFQVVRAFPRFLGALAAQIDDWRLRMELVENLFEEHGRSKPAAVHVVTYRSFLHAIGIGEGEIDQHVAGLPSTVYVRAVLDLCARQSIGEAVGALAVIEEIVARVSPIVARFGALRSDGSKLGSHFSAHEVLDVSHANELYDVAGRLGAGAAPSVLCGMQLGMYYHTRLYADLVALAQTRGGR